MAGDKIRVVERLYELWNEGASMAPLLHPEFEWTQAPDAVEPGTLRGVEAAGAAVAKIRETFPEFHIEPERYVEHGDHVVVVYKVRARTEGGMEVELRGGAVWTVEDGKLARFRDFGADAQEAFNAVGLRP